MVKLRTFPVHLDVSSLKFVLDHSQVVMCLPRKATQACNVTSYENKAKKIRRWILPFEALNTWLLAQVRSPQTLPPQHWNMHLYVLSY